MKNQTPLDRIVEIVGTKAKLADELGVSPQAVSQWPPIPPKHAIAIEKLTGGQVTRHEIAPAMYPSSDAAA
jgi:DNA-binding transcriptional regulator YdaS (Cro superfamily)